MSSLFISWFDVHVHGLGRAAMFFFVSVTSALSLAAASPAGRRTYDLPANDAASALKLFSEQSGRGVIAGTDLVRGIRTNSVRGALTAAEALGRMLAGTGLTGIEDSESGTFAVRKETEAPKQGQSTAREREGESLKKTTPNSIPTRNR